MIALDLFRNEYLDVHFTPCRGMRARVVERPGRWMDAAAQARIVDDIRSVIAATVPGGSLEYGVVADADRLKNAVLTVIYRESDGKPVAFNALHVLECELNGKPVEVVHLGLVVVDPGARQSGLTCALYGLTCFLLCLRRRLRPFWISNVTQVPAVFGIVADFVDDVYPSPREGAHASPEHVQIARQVATRHRAVYGTGPEARFDEVRFVLEDSYTGGSDNLKKRLDEAPLHRDAAVNRMCRMTLDYDRGDDFLQVGRFTVGVARRYLAHSPALPRPVRGALAALLLVVEHVVAPLMQWSLGRRDSHDLRALRAQGEAA